MPNNFWTYGALTFSIAVLTASAAHTYEDPTRICATDANALKKFEGEYASEVFLTTLRKTRSFPQALTAENEAGEAKSESHPVAVSISSMGILASYGWHEGSNIDCVMATDSKLKLVDSSKSYVRISKSYSAKNADGPYFDVLFQGCFLDDTRQRWCFKPGAIEIAGKTHTAALELDPSEHEFENAVHIDNDRTRFWFFRPMAGGGWLVFQGGWLTDGSPPVEWAKPWRKLQPAP